MKKIAFLISGIFFISSCTSEQKIEGENVASQKEEVTTAAEKADDLPEAKWNGEYLKVVDGDEPKIKRKSQGSDFYSMGNVSLIIEGDSIKFKLFERKKNVLTFTTERINAFIKSAFNEDVHLTFKKTDIVTQHKGEYKADPTGKSMNSVKMTVISGEKEYSLQDGVVEIISFSPRLGTLELKIDGTFKAKDGSKKQGKGAIKMNFEHAVMTVS